MRTVNLAAALSAALLMQACVGTNPQDASELATRASALTTAVSRGCTFTVTSRENSATLPPRYEPVITRQASAACPWSSASVALPGSHSPTTVSIAATDQGVAVSYTNKYSPSGSAGTWLELRHLAPDPLAVVRSDTLQAMTADYRPSYISSGEPSMLSNGTTLRIRGQKGGIIIGESGSGPYYTATYPNFFTSTENRTIVASAEAPPAESWGIDGFLSTPRAGHTATLINTTGDVLVVSDSSAEVYNPYTHVSTPTGAPIYARTKHTATWLPSGKVLVAGGWIGNAPLYWRHTSELFDPATGSWTFASFMNTPRGNHTATLLDSGKLLVVGGSSTHGDTSSVELYDPDANTWSNAAPLNGARSNHTATLLYSGQVLVTGGTSASSALQDAQLYEPATNTWTPTGTMTRARSGHLAVRLYSGHVMVLGGGSNTVDLYDPYNNTWSEGPSLYDGESAASATLLYSGGLLVTHKYGRSSLYDPSTNTWTSTGGMQAALSGHAATLLHTGQVLVTGGSNFIGLSATVQQYTH